MGEKEESETPKYQVSLKSNKVFVGCEIVPIVRFQTIHPKQTLKLPPLNITFTWYREKELKCCVHDSKLSTIQCLCCVQLKRLQRNSYFCSQQCFRNHWKKEHSECNLNAIKNSIGGRNGQTKLRSCGSWPDFSNFTLEESEEFVKRDGNLWIKVGCSKTYVPCEDDNGYLLRLESTALDSSNANLQVFITEPVAALPSSPPRHMLHIRTPASNFYHEAQPTQDVTFSVLSYNILCDSLAYDFMYPHCPNWALAWEYRRQKLLHEIIEYNADIICLQEVQNDHFENFFKPVLTKQGYSAMYKQKPNKIYTENEYISDGCATFFRCDLFKEIMKYEVEFDKAASKFVEALEPEKREEGRRRLAKGNVALVVMFEVKRKGRFHKTLQPRFCVANTHIFANEEFPYVKLFQVTYLVNELEKICVSKVPFIICGDFNSLPKSNPYGFILQRPIDVLSEKEKIDPFGICRFLKLSHSVPLASAYSSLFGSDGIEDKQLKKMNHKTKEPLFTHLGPTFSGTLDYIFYTAGMLTVEGLLEPLDREDTGHYLPSTVWSSDHIALMASFRLRAPYRASLHPANPWIQTGTKWNQTGTAK